MGINSLIHSMVFFQVTSILFRLILDISYIYFVHPIFNYAGYDLNIDPFSYFLSWVVYFIFSIISPYKLKKISDYFYATALLALIAPLSSIYGLSEREIYPFMVTVMAILIVRFIAESSLFKIPKFKSMKNGLKYGVFISLFFVMLLVLWYVASGAISYFNLDFLKVYEFRAKSSELSNIGFLAYLNNWTYKVFSIFLMSWALYTKKYTFFLVLVIIQVFFYGVTNHKAVLFYPFLVLGIWFYFRKFSALSIANIGYTVIVLYALAMYFFKSDVLTGSMMIRRVFFVPAFLTYEYFDFFSENKHIIWSNSVLSFINEYPYELDLSKLIGEYSGDDASANNGFISTGYAHANIYGVILYSFLFGYLLRIINIISKKGLPIWFVLCMMIVTIRIALISSDLLTTILSHGLLVAMLLLIISRKKETINSL